MSKKHSVIIIPGLGDEVNSIELATGHWKKFGLEPVVHSVGWHDEEANFAPKLSILLNLVDELVENNDTLSLVGTSAGGSAVINAFYERKNKVHKVVNVCGRLRVGTKTGFRSFSAKTRSSRAFEESVKLCESRLSTFSQESLNRVMTVRAMFGDELVPPDTVRVQGALNTQIPTVEHILTIGMALTIFSKPIISFLKNT